MLTATLSPAITPLRLDPLRLSAATLPPSYTLEVAPTLLSVSEAGVMAPLKMFKPVRV